MAKKTELHKKTYSAKDITALTPQQHLLKRLNLTLGRETGDETDPFSSQKSVAAREIIDNGNTELLRNYGDRIRVTFYKDGSVEVQDNGRGLPTDTTVNAFGETVSGFIITMGTLQSGENLGENEGGGKSTNQNGLGGSAVNFLSTRLDIKVYKDKKVYSLSFKKGEPGFFEKEGDPHSKFTKLKDLTFIKEDKDNRSQEEKKKFSKGTSIRFWLNDKSFSSPYPIDVQDMITRLRGLAFLLPNKTIEVINEFVEDGKEPQHEIFNFSDGLPALVDLNQVGTPIINNTIHYHTVGEYLEKDVPVTDKETKTLTYQDLNRTTEIEFAFSYSSNYSYSMDSYVNTIRTRLGGVHTKAFENALVKAFNEKFANMKSVRTAKDPLPTIDDYKEGLTVVLSVYVAEPQFTSQIKEELGGKIVQKAIEKAIYDKLVEFANANKNFELMKVIGAKVHQAAKNRQSKKEELELKREQSKISRQTALPEKLVDCEHTHQPFSELFITEGDSASSALKPARLSSFQALFPIRGKIINVYSSPAKAIMANTEIKAIMTLLGSGIGEDFVLEDARYQRVILAVDADTDGGQIACLLLVFFYRYYRTLVENGCLYKLNSPLFTVKTSKTRYYAESETELEAIKKNLAKTNTKYKIVRNKGLGETGADDLRYTSMDPATRSLTRITLGDCEEAERWLEIAMGDNPDLRKEWIEANPLDSVED